VAAEPAEAEAAGTHVEGVPEVVEASEDEQRGPGTRPRRGRRGGRRRRHEGDGEMPPHAAPGADQPDLPPVYTGPTPANPFGGNTFDIFDVMDQAEAAAPAPVAAPVETRAEPTPVAGLEPENAPLWISAEPSPILAEPMPVEAEPVPTVAEQLLLVMAEARPTLAEPSPVEAEAPAPQPETTPQPQPVAVEPEPLVAANDAAAEPAVKPILIGAGEAPVAEKKRGWWRR
jgi:ribonuclease E